MKVRDIQWLAYERFQMYWLLTHGITMTDISKKASFWLQEFRESEETVNLKEYIEKENGFHGSIYPCYKEFLDAEYQNRELMKCILTSEEFVQYAEAVEPRFKVFYKADKEKCDGEYIKYWSNSSGVLFDPSTRKAISEDQLPAELFRAYRLLWRDVLNAKTYLAQTEKGFCFALSWVATDNEHYAALMCQWAAELASMDENKAAEVIFDEDCDGQDEVQILLVFPATISTKDFAVSVKFAEEFMEQKFKEA